MFFILSKVLSFLISPIVWMFLLLLMYFVFKRKKWSRILIIISVAIFFLFSNQLLFYKVCGWWEGELQNPNKLEKYDGVIVLGGFSSYQTEKQRIRFYGSADRLFQALQLYKMGKVEYFVFAGGSARIIQKERKEGEFIKEYLSLLGVEGEKVLIDHNSRNTYENAVETKSLLQEKGIENGQFLLVTSGFHMKRATKCFEKIDINIHPYIADPLQATLPPDFADSLIPSAIILGKWELLFKEWIGYVMYGIKGYL